MQILITVLVVDDSPEWRNVMRVVVDRMPRLRILAEAADGVQAVEKAQALKPDMVLLDIGLPRLNGIEVARHIIRISPKCKIVFVTEQRDYEVITESLRAGGMAYVVKCDANSDLPIALAAALEGVQFFSQTLSSFSLQT